MNIIFRAAGLCQKARGGQTGVKCCGTLLLGRAKGCGIPQLNPHTQPCTVRESSSYAF